MGVRPDRSANVSQMLGKWPDGDRDAASRLMLLVNQELQARASVYPRREYPDRTLQPSALVHQAYFKLAIEDEATCKKSAHFRAIAATLIRRILVQHARDHNGQERSGRGAKTSLQQSCGIHQEGVVDLIALDEALERFGLVYSRASAVVEMKFFGGLRTDEIAESLQVSPDTVLRDWKLAKLWLLRELNRKDAR